MAKLLQSTSLLLFFFLLSLSGCKTQAPTPTDSGAGWQGGDIIPLEEGWGLAPREPGAIDNEAKMYNGRAMVEGILQDVYFSFDSYSIASTERSKLQAAADYLQANPQDGLLIEGYCDWYGTADYNLALGDRRAKSIRDYLITLGINGNRIETLSKGSLEATPGLSKPEAQQDRRGELIVLQ
jgi:peptidoglycan-associated lipoprotein